jgi:peptide/nickel transport system substrate-binding protein
VAGLAAGCAAPAAPPAAPPVAPTTPGLAAPVGTAAAAAPTVAARAPKYGGTLRTTGFTGHQNFDHDTSAGWASPTYTYVVAYSGLLKLKHGPDVKSPALIAAADLAESWTQPDDLTYIFKLRQGVKFHNIAPVNGRELVADDIVFSFNRQRDLKFNSANFTNVLKMEAPDKNTFKVTLDQPNADILANLADDRCRVVAHEIVDKNGDLKQGPVVGTGPWLVDKVEFGRYDYLVRNPDYFLKGLPYLDRLEINHIADNPSVLAAFQAGQLDVIGAGLPSDYDTVIKSVPQAKTLWILQDTSGEEIGFNVTKKPFDDVRVRQAVVKALDFQVMGNTIWSTRGELTPGLVFPDFSWKLPNDELQRLFKRDLEGAKRLLQEAGLGGGFQAECILEPNIRSGAYQTEAELFQQQLRDINVNITLKPVPLATFTQLQQNGDYQMYVHNQSGLSSANADLLGRYHSKGPGNYTNFSDPTLDRLIEQQAGMSRDPEGRRKIFQDIQRLVIDKAFKLGTWTGATPAMYYPYLTNYYPPSRVSVAVDYWTDIWLDR